MAEPITFVITFVDILMVVFTSASATGPWRTHDPAHGHGSSIFRMYSTWSFDNSRISSTKPKTSTGHAQQERDMRTNAIELILSVMFSQRGVPLLDSFTVTRVGAFRRVMDFNPVVEGHERKFMSLVRWGCPDIVATLWTIEPVVSSTIIRGNSIDVSFAHDTYSAELECIEPMSMTTHTTSVKPGNEIWGRWAGWLVWRASRDQGWLDAVCSSCNASSSLFAVSLHRPNANVIHLVMDPETINILAIHPWNMATSMNVTATMSAGFSTRMIIQPAMRIGRNTSLRLFGNGSMHFCSSPNDIELLYSAAYRIVKRVLETDTRSFLSSMRIIRSSMV
ncbi:hypothetical protein AYL99_11879 [Fonsecaea erecta]|uniref:Uncharacterized protein n=1 Tax=Fonsecaea erecta TaxID=1367422 RepID=A0A178Z2C1_9EURO|nr:hypothetical protein AYL99_11879 [Fonsecaea erecta]OAP53857.1 hypothetical protein AYL99_11879 [Fonsecaea erecta]